MQDKEYLLKEIGSKLQTVNIGSISQFETYFGILWGHGKREEELNDSEREWRTIWQECRKNVLDNGNNQLRLLQQSMQWYNIARKNKTLNVGSYVNGKYVMNRHPVIMEEKNGKE